MAMERIPNIAPHSGKSKAAGAVPRAAFVRAVTLMSIVLVGACAGVPATRLDAAAGALGLVATELDGGPFRLRVFEPTAPRPRTGWLHVYLDGDGRPFVRPGRLARDPTPQDPLTLRLLAMDPNPALYLGRPCYHAMPGPCETALWTAARYGEAVVESLAHGLGSIAARHPDTRLVLIGYSGGGALAMLAAARVPQVAAVVTLAANLDTGAWTEWHGYPPLSGSLDPARDTPPALLPRSLHFAGARDREVPPRLQAGFATRTPSATFREIADFDHRCCWARDWPDLLVQIVDWRDASGTARQPAPRAP